jgi:hypothetical protein
MKKTILVTLEMDVEDTPMSEDDVKMSQEGLKPEEIEEMGPESISHYPAKDMADGLSCAVDNPEASAGTFLWFTIKDVRIKTAEFKP